MGNMKKIISSILLIIILFNFIFLNKAYSAVEDTDSSFMTEEAVPSESIIDNIADEGKAAEKQGNAVPKSLDFSSFGTSIVGAILGILARLFNLIVALEVDVLMGQLTYTSENGELQYFITIDRIFNFNYNED